MNINSIHQIEITSNCNLRCRYCPHPHMQREKMDMDEDIYGQALDWVSYFIGKGTQTDELNLAGIGESTLHPHFEYFVEMARFAVGSNCKLILATNGVNMSEYIAQVLKEHDVWTWVSLHRPEKAGPAVELLKKYGVLKGVSADPSVASIDWAGQVEWFVSAQTKDQPCPWLHDGRVVVLADGRVSTCCLDSTGVGIVGEVYSDLTKAELKPYSLCNKCHLQVPQQ